MAYNHKLFMVTLPVLMILVTGWLMFLIDFSVLEHKYLTEESKQDYSDAVYQVPFWLFAVTVPATVFFVGFYSCTMSYIMGITSKVFVFICGFFLGGCLPSTVVGLHYHHDKEGDNLLIARVVGLIGLLLSLLSLAAIVVVMPYFVNKYGGGNHDPSYDVLRDDCEASLQQPL